MVLSDATPEMGKVEHRRFRDLKGEMSLLEAAGLLSEGGWPPLKGWARILGDIRDVFSDVMGETLTDGQGDYKNFS